MSDQLAAPRRVLVVEDDQDTRDVMEDMLQLLGYATHGIADADDLVAAARAFDPHLIILDVQLPGHQAGTAALVRLRDDGILTPVLLYSGQYDAAQVGAMAHYTRVIGGQAFMPKPVDLDELQWRVAALIGPARP